MKEGEGDREREKVLLFKSPCEFIVIYKAKY